MYFKSSALSGSQSGECLIVGISIVVMISAYINLFNKDYIKIINVTKYT